MFTFSAKRELEQFQKYLGQLETILRWDDARLYQVKDYLSLMSPAQQVDHTLLVAKGIFEYLQIIYVGDSPKIVRRSLPPFKGLPALWTGWIPRGAGKSPANLLPPPEVTREEILPHLADCKKELRRAQDRASEYINIRGKLPHPVFGPLDSVQWIRFLAIHTKHHLKLIDDIDKAVRR